MKPLTLLALLACATPAFAETPLSGKEFSNLTTGHTFDFSVDGVTYGREYYMSGGNVIWSNMSGPCEYGRWFEDADTGQLCFVYEYAPTDTKCWEISPMGQNYSAQFKSNENDPRPYTMTQNDAPLQCTGPSVGA